MGKLLKWLLGLIVFLVVLVIAAVVVLPLVIDPNDYKEEIVAQVKQTTGRELQIQGPLSLSVIPALAVRLEDVSLSNAPGFGDTPFAVVKELDLNVKLLPLLSKRVEVDTVVLQGLGLNLARNANGKTNWEDLIKAPQDKQKPVATKEKMPSSGASDFTFRVKGIRVESASLSWDDRRADQKITINDVRLVTGALAPGSDVPLEAGFKLVSDKPRLTLVLGLNGTIAVSSDLQRYNATPVKLDLSAAGDGLPADGIELALTTNLDYDQTAGTLQLSDLAVAGPQIRIAGQVHASALNVDPKADATLQLQETNLKNLLASFGAQIETKDKSALTRASGELGVRFGGGTLDIEPIKVKLDDSYLKGEVKLSDFAGPTVRATLTVDAIDLDRYLPPANAQQSANDRPSKEQAPPTGADPFAALRTLDLDAKATIGRVKINNLRLSELHARIVAKDGILQINPAQAKLYQGTFNGLLQLDARQSTPKARLRNALTNVQIGPLVKDLTGEERLLGVGEVNADLRVVGLSEARVRNTLNGTARLALRDGAVKGINLAELIRQAQSAMGKDVSEPPNETNRTDFSELSASAKVTNGIIDNQDLKAKSPLLRVEGKGQVNLPKDKINYLVITEVVNSLEGQGGKGRDKLTGIPIPIRLKGSLQDPKPTVDLQAALNAEAKQQLEKKQRELKKQVEKKAKKELDKALKGLFK